MNGKEIEIKLLLEEVDYSRLIFFLSEVASSTSQKHQVDVYYSPTSGSFYNSGDRCLRVRIEGSKAILSYKRIYNENTSKQFIEEHETFVDNFDVIDHILKGLSFQQEIVVDKFRIEYWVKKDFLVSLDKVENLGYFIEIENRNESDNLERRNHDLYEFVEQLQLDISRRNTEGYSNMLFKKRHLQGDNEQ